MSSLQPLTVASKEQKGNKMATERKQDGDIPIMILVIKQIIGKRTPLLA